MSRVCSSSSYSFCIAAAENLRIDTDFTSGISCIETVGRFEPFLARHSTSTGSIRFTSGQSDVWPRGLNLAPWIPMRKRCAPCAHPIGDPCGRVPEEFEGSLS